MKFYPFEFTYQDRPTINLGPEGFFTFYRTLVQARKSTVIHGNNNGIDKPSQNETGYLLKYSAFVISLNIYSQNNYLKVFRNFEIIDKTVGVLAMSTFLFFCSVSKLAVDRL